MNTIGPLRRHSGENLRASGFKQLERFRFDLELRRTNTHWTNSSFISSLCERNTITGRSDFLSPRNGFVRHNHDETGGEKVTVDRNQLLTEQFETHRSHLRAVAFRMLGSLSEAEDAVQETWLRLNRSDSSEIENLAGWLTTVVARVCLDMLRSRKGSREDSLELPIH